MTRSGECNVYQCHACISQVRPRSRAKERRSQFESSGFLLRGQDLAHLGQHQSVRSWPMTTGSEPAEDVSLHVEWKDESSDIGAIIHRGDSSGGPRTVVLWKRSELAPTFISPLDRLKNLVNIRSSFLTAVVDGFPDSPLPVHLTRESLNWNIIASNSYRSPGLVCWEGC